MRASGCVYSGCEWPNDKALDIQPVLIDISTKRVLCDCFWGNYIHPPTQRGYSVCEIHYRSCERAILGNIKEDLEVTQWQISQTSTPPTRSRVSHG